MKRTQLRKISKKQSRINRELDKVRHNLSPYCIICGRPATDLSHLLPRSLYAEYYTEEWNIVPMCREHHFQFDNNVSFRQNCISLYNRVKEHDERAAHKHFDL